MLAPGQLYLLVLTVLLLGALAAAVPVLVGIVREGRERRRRGAPHPPGGDDESGGRTCQHCGTVNDTAFTFCRDCLERL